MTSSIILIAVVNLVNQILGFTRDSLVTFYYGASAITDSYVVSVIIPSVIIGVIASGINSAFVPECIRFEKKTKKSGIVYTQVMMFTSIALGIVGILVVNVFKEELLSIFANGFTQETKEYSLRFITITAYSMPIILLNNILLGYFQIKEKQLLASLFVMPSNLVGIGLVYYSYLSDNVALLPMCYVVSLLVTSILSLTFSKGLISSIDVKIFRPSSIMDYGISTYRIALPVMFGVSANQINFVIDRSLATTVYEGAVSLVNISVRVSSIIEAIIISSVMLVFYPIMSRNRDELEKIKVNVMELFLIGFVLILPITLTFIFFSNDIISILFGRGAFTESNVQTSARLLQIYSVSMPLVFIKVIFSKWMYSLGETKLPTKVSLLGICINVILNFALIEPLGLAGLAISTLLSNLVTVLIALYIMFKKDMFFSECKYLLHISIFSVFFLTSSLYILGLKQMNMFYVDVVLVLLIYMFSVINLIRFIFKKSSFYQDFIFLNKNIL